MDVCSRSLNQRIVKLDKGLSIAYGNFSSTFKEPLAKGDTITVHQRNLRTLNLWLLNM